MKYDEFEQKLLALATQTSDPLTPAYVGLKLGIRIQEASRYLDRMTLDGHVSLESDDEGRIHYEVIGISRPGDGAASWSQTSASGSSLWSSPAQSEEFNPAVAGFLSLILPGSGQIYRREYGRGILFFTLAFLLYGIPIAAQNLYLVVLVLPALVVHILSVALAAKHTRSSLPLSPTSVSLQQGASRPSAQQEEIDESIPESHSHRG